MQPIPAPLNLKPLKAAETFVPPTPAEREEKLAHATQEFATLVYANFVKQMREASESEEGGGLFSGDAAMFASFFDQALAKDFAAQQGNALVTAIDRQLGARLKADQAAGGQP